MTQAEEIFQFFMPGDILSLGTLYDLMVFSHSSIRRTVYGLVDEGKLWRVGRGLYELAEERDTYRQTVAVRCVVHNAYVNIVAHYYGASEKDAYGHVPALMAAILEDAVLVTGYHNSQVSDFLISDVARLPYDARLIGTTDVEEEWEL